MHCPRCGVELVPQDLFTGGRHATVGACHRCGGQWMRASDLRRLSEIVEPVVHEWLTVQPDAQHTELRCPQCEPGEVMEKLTSPRDPRVLFDACNHCGGIWLDGGELRAIQQESIPALASAFLSRRR